MYSAVGSYSERATPVSAQQYPAKDFMYTQHGRDFAYIPFSLEFAVGSRL